jgi:Polyglycine hydrolase-like, structural repeat
MIRSYLSSPIAGPDINRFSDRQNAWDCNHSSIEYAIFDNQGGGYQLIAYASLFGNYDVARHTCRHDGSGFASVGSSAITINNAPASYIAIKAWQHNDKTIGHTGTYCDDINCWWPSSFKVNLAGPPSPPPAAGSLRFTAAFQRSEEPEIQVYGWRYEDYRAKYDELWSQGWRLKLFDAYVVNGQVRYTAVWRPSTEGELQLYGWTVDGLLAKYDELWPQGWRLKLLDSYILNRQVRYVAVFQPSDEPEIQGYGSYAGHDVKYGHLWSQGWRLKLMTTAQP